MCQQFSLKIRTLKKTIHTFYKNTHSAHFVAKKSTFSIQNDVNFHHVDSKKGRHYQKHYLLSHFKL